jgi:hypothetical protein
MIVVEIHDPADGRVSHEIGPFKSNDPRKEAEEWAARFVRITEYDSDFVEVRDVDRRLTDPYDDFDEIVEYYS